MKFQKTLLVVSLGLAAGVANAAVVDQVANPVLVTENLFNAEEIYHDFVNVLNKTKKVAVDANGNPILVNGLLTYVDVVDVDNVVSAPVHGEEAATTNLFNINAAGQAQYQTAFAAEINKIPANASISDRQLLEASAHQTALAAVTAANRTSVVVDQDVDYLPIIGFKNVAANTYTNGLGQTVTVGTGAGNKILDLGIKAVAPSTSGSGGVKYDVFKYKTQDGTTVYRFQNPVTGQYSDKYYTAVRNGNQTIGGKVLPRFDLQVYQGTSAIDVNTLERGGQIDGGALVTTATGYENRQVNGEHVVYGYQGGTTSQAASINGTIVNPEAQEEFLTGNIGDVGGPTTDIRYVQTGILANTGNGSYTDPAKNIYGTSARDNNKVTMMTGNGVAVADLTFAGIANPTSNNGVLHTDGSVVNRVAESTIKTQTNKTREYRVNGLQIVEVYNDDAGRVLESKYYVLGADGNLSEYKGAQPTAGTHIKTGTTKDTFGVYNQSKVHNTVTSKNVTYKENITREETQEIIAGITTPSANTTAVDTAKFTDTKVLSQTEQYASTGKIGRAHV